jgi:hypothetical protein
MVQNGRTEGPLLLRTEYLILDRAAKQALRT